MSDQKASSPVRARQAAVERLLRIENDDAFVARLTETDGDDGDARNISHWVAGVTRHRRWLDFLISRFYRGDFFALDPPLLQILRIGAYDLVVRGIPPHAAVGEAVETARVTIHKGAAGLANGLLRSMARAQPDLPEPKTGDSGSDLAVRHSHPTWMVRRWLDRLGPEATLALLQHNNAAPFYGVRANLRRGDRDALLQEIVALDSSAEASPWLDDFVRTQQMQPLLRGGLLASGRCAVQDEAAGLVVRVLDPQPGELVLDGAAAPGGKSLYIAERMSDSGQVVAVDVSSAKLNLLRKAARAHGTEIIEAITGDLRTWEHEPAFDRVLVDAPCSGTGVLAKRADLRWKRTEEDLIALLDLQDELLRSAAAFVKPGGLLVYSTCSIEPEENEARVQAVLAASDHFALEPVSDLVPAAMAREDGAYFQALPHVHGTDGAFAARLRRAG